MRQALVRQALGYGVASAAALLVDVSVLWLLVSGYGWPYLAAATVSFLIGAVVAYVLSVRLAFKEHRLHNRQAELLAFVVIGAIGLAVNAAVISIAVAALGLHYLLAKCVAAAFTFTWNFFARRQMLFVRRSAA
jgi:putative flippase GtrA